MAIYKSVYFHSYDTVKFIGFMDWASSQSHEINYFNFFEKKLTTTMKIIATIISFILCNDSIVSTYL
jgi:hypothetical protein